MFGHPYANLMLREGRTMYGEIIIGLNTLFNFTILSFANKMQNHRVRFLRLMLASFIGAVAVVFVASNLFSLFITFIFMTIVAYGINLDRWKTMAMTALLGAVFAGGLLTALQTQLKLMASWTLVIYAVIAYLLLLLLKQTLFTIKTAEQLSALAMSSQLTLWDKEIPLKVFIDSGNTCTEPLSGKAVHFLAFEAVESILPPTLKDFLVHWETKGKQSSSEFPEEFQQQLRLIKVTTVHGASWVIGIHFKQWELEGGKKIEDGYIVLTKETKRYPDGAQAILHVSAM